ncbi:MAG: M42 family metallopeptidase [Oscillospiraceae bacterium]
MIVEQYRKYLLDTAKAILMCDSPSGYTHDILMLTRDLAGELGYKVSQTKRGGLVITIDGRDNSHEVACFAHMDTVGLTIRNITEHGELMFSPIGLPVLPSLDGEYCRIHTREGKTYSGTILSLSPAYHVYKDASTRPRDQENMYIRLDMPVSSKSDVSALGIRCGDIVSIDPKTEITESGYIKSRFLDDKASVACLLTLLRLMNDQKIKPKFRTHFVFTVYEEVGSGGAWQPGDLAEFLIVDMGCVGPELNCTEQQVSICSKDSDGPYDYEMTTRLIHLAEENGVNYATDVYPYYGSDANAIWRSGCDASGALIGTGVHASHGMERTHIDGMINTLKLIALYLDCK